MDDMKIFAKNKKELESFVQTASSANTKKWNLELRNA